MRSLPLAALGGATLSACARALRLPGDGDADRLGELPHGHNIMFANTNPTTLEPGQPSSCSVFQLYQAAVGGADTTLRRIRLGEPSARADLVIGVITNKGMHRARAHPHFAYHRKQLNDDTMLVYFTNGPFPEAPNAPHDDKGGDGYHDATQRYLMAWHYVANGCNGLEYRWYFQIDDDTAVSIPRMWSFLGALEPQLGSPYEKSVLVGRMTTWWNVTMCGELFGGNGILATRKAMQTTGALGNGAWDEALTQVQWGDGQLAMIAHKAKCSLVAMHVPFGIGTWRAKDEMAAGEGLGPRKLEELTAYPWANATLSLHKVADRLPYAEAKTFFGLPSAQTDDYGVLLDEVRWQFDRACYTRAVPKAKVKKPAAGKDKNRGQDKGKVQAGGKDKNRGLDKTKVQAAGKDTYRGQDKGKPQDKAKSPGAGEDNPQGKDHGKATR